MRGLAFLFFVTASIYLVVGMVWGIQMSATGDHLLSPAHGHLNLLGGVLLAIYGLYYHLVPAAEESRLSRVHFGLAQLSVLIMVPGIMAAILEKGALVAKIGSGLALLSGIVFLLVVVSSRHKTA